MDVVWQTVSISGPTAQKRKVGPLAFPAKRCGGSCHPSRRSPHPDWLDLDLAFESYV